MGHRRKLEFSMVLALALVIGAAWLLTFDVHSDGEKRYPGADQAESTGSFCGSAYDVVLLKGDGFMGGEVPVNQAVLDAQCVRKAGRLVAVGSAMGTGGVLLGSYGALEMRRRRRSRITESRSVSAIS